jgi:ABC-2 type transport system permease protein
VTARSRAWFNPDLYSRNYVVPGVVANIIMMVTLMVEAEHGKELPNAV